MKKILFILWFFICSVLYAQDLPYDDHLYDIRGSLNNITSFQLPDILQVLTDWADMYPQCYQNVAKISQSVERMLSSSSSSSNLDGVLKSLQDIISNSADLLSFTAGNQDLLGDIDFFISNLPQISQSLLALADVKKYLQWIYDFGIDDYLYSVMVDTSRIWVDTQYICTALDNTLGVVSYIWDSLSVLDGISGNLSSLAAGVTVDNLEELREILDGLSVSIAGDLPSITATIEGYVPFEFDYDYFEPIRYVHYGLQNNLYSLPTITTYHPDSPFFSSDASYSSLIRSDMVVGGDADFFAMLAKYCSMSLQNQSYDQMFLSQILGAMKHTEEGDELKQSAQSAADSVTTDLDTLNKALAFDSITGYVDSFNVYEDIRPEPVLIGDGSQLPSVVTIGPIPVSKIIPSASDLTIDIDTSHLSFFFDLCRWCFGVFYYLVTITLIIRFVRAVIRKILTTSIVTHVISLFK